MDDEDVVKDADVFSKRRDAKKAAEIREKEEAEAEAARQAAGGGEEAAQGARSCDLEGNRAGLGCLEHLRNALSFAVVTAVACRSVSTSPAGVTTSCP